MNSGPTVQRGGTGTLRVVLQHLAQPAMQPAMKAEVALDDAAWRGRRSWHRPESQVYISRVQLR